MDCHCSRWTVVIAMDWRRLCTVRKSIQSFRGGNLPAATIWWSLSYRPIQLHRMQGVGLSPWKLSRIGYSYHERSVIGHVQSWSWLRNRAKCWYFSDPTSLIGLDWEVSSDNPTNLASSRACEAAGTPTFGFWDACQLGIRPMAKEWQASR